MKESIYPGFPRRACLSPGHESADCARGSSPTSAASCNPGQLPGGGGQDPRMRECDVRLTCGVGSGREGSRPWRRKFPLRPRFPLDDKNVCGRENTSGVPHSSLGRTPQCSEPRGKRRRRPGRFPRPFLNIRRQWSWPHRLALPFA